MTSAPVNLKQEWDRGLVPTPFGLHTDCDSNLINTYHRRISGETLQRAFLRTIALNHWDATMQFDLESLIIGGNETRQRSWLTQPVYVARVLYVKEGQIIAEERERYVRELSELGGDLLGFPAASQDPIETCAGLTCRAQAHHLRELNKSGSFSSILWPTIGMMQCCEWFPYFGRICDDKYTYKDHFFHSLYIAFLGSQLLRAETRPGLGGQPRTVADLVLDAITLPKYIRMTGTRFENLSNALDDPSNPDIGQRVSDTGDSVVRALESLKNARHRLEVDISREFIVAAWWLTSVFHDYGYYAAGLKGILDVYDYRAWKKQASRLPHGDCFRHSFGWLNESGIHTETHKRLGAYKYLLIPDTHVDSESSCGCSDIKTFDALWDRARRADFHLPKEYYYDMKNAHVLFGYLELVDRLLSMNDLGMGVLPPFEALTLYMAADATFRHHNCGRGVWSSSWHFPFRDSPFGFLLRLLDQLQSAARGRLILKAPSPSVVGFNVGRDNSSFIINTRDGQWHILVDWHMGKSTYKGGSDNPDDTEVLGRLFEWMSNDPDCRIGFPGFRGRTHRAIGPKRVDGKWAYQFERI